MVGAALRAITGADWGAWIGGSVLGVLGAILGMRFGLFFGALNRIKSGWLFGGIVGVVTGAVLGAFAGVAVTAWMGAIPGAIIGSLVLRFLTSTGSAAPQDPFLGSCRGRNWDVHPGVPPGLRHGRRGHDLWWGYRGSGRDGAFSGIGPFAQPSAEQKESVMA